MFILQIVGWFIGSCILMSFIEHQVHTRLMHRPNFLSERTASFKRTFEAHALVHHKDYSRIFSDEPVPPGEDKEIRMTPYKGMLRAIPIALLIGLIAWQGAIIFVLVVGMHHQIWNMIHLEMHKPEQRFFSNWPIYKFLAQHHCLHHIHQNKNFNVVFPFADYILGTNVQITAADIESMQKMGFSTKSERVLTHAK
jgi:hypothetical protein